MGQLFHTDGLTHAEKQSQVALVACPFKSGCDRQRFGRALIRACGARSRYMRRPLRGCGGGFNCALPGSHAWRRRAQVRKYFRCHIQVRPIPVQMWAG